MVARTDTDAVTRIACGRRVQVAKEEIKRLENDLQRKETMHLRAVNNDDKLTDEISALVNERDRLTAENARLRGERNNARSSTRKPQGKIAASTVRTERSDSKVQEHANTITALETSIEQEKTENTSLQQQNATVRKCKDTLFLRDSSKKSPLARSNRNSKS